MPINLDDLKASAVEPSAESYPTKTQTAAVDVAIPTEPLKPTADTPVRTPLDMSKIAPPAPKKPIESMEAKLYGDLDKAIQRNKEETWDRLLVPLSEKLATEKLFGEKGEEAYFGSEDTSTIPDSDLLSGGLEDDSLLTQGTTILPPKNIFDEEGETSMGSEFIPSTEEPKKPSFQLDTGEPITAPEVVTDSVKVPEEKTIATQRVVQPEPEKESDKVIPMKSTDDGLPVDDDSTASDESTEAADEPPANLDLNDEDMDDIFGDDEDKIYELSEDEQRESVEEVKAEIKRAIKVVDKVIDLSQYKVSSKPMATSRLLQALQASPTHSAQWVYYHTGKPFTMTSFKGNEIEKLNPTPEEGQNPVIKAKEVYSTFYKHIIDPNKPDTLEAWLKSVLWQDVEQLYVGAYLATFSNSTNIVPYTCPKCKHSFTKIKPIKSMIKMNDTVAKEVKEIMSMDPNESAGTIDAIMEQVSDDVVIAFRKPTIYTVEIENYYVPDKLAQAYPSLVEYINCIEVVYLIDRDKNELVPVNTNPVPNDLRKTVRNKYKVYIDILRSLTSDQYSLIPTYITKLSDDKDKDSHSIKYCTPEEICPKCEKKIEESSMNAVEMLFSRHRLQTIMLL